MKIKSFFTSKGMKYGTYSAAITLAVIVIAVIFTLIGDMLVNKFPLKWDLSENKIYEISDETQEILKNLEKDVDIIWLVSGVQEAREIDEIINNYTRETSKLHFREVDVNKNPGFEQKYIQKGDTLNALDFIIESGNRFKIVRWTNITESSQYGQFLLLEQKLTSAISYVVENKDIVISFTKGHGEFDYTQAGLAEILEENNYVHSDIDLLTEEIADDAGTIVIIAPTRDFDEKEIIKLDAFADKGKSIIYMPKITDEFYTNLDGYFGEWGIEAKRDFVIETDSKQLAVNSMTRETIPIPLVLEHDITNRIKDINFIARQSRSIAITQQPGVDAKPLLTTTDKAYAKTDFTSGDFQKSSEDTSGPFNLAVIASKNIYNPNNEVLISNLLVTGGYAWLEFTDPNFSTYSNRDFLISGLNYINDKGDTVTSGVKMLNSTSILNMTEENIFNVIIILAAMPIIAIIAGLFVFFRRKSL